jgi:hypothetical protein
MNVSLLEYFRCPEQITELGINGNLSSEAGFFQFGRGITCYGKCSVSAPSPDVSQVCPDISEGVRFEHGRLDLPFDFKQTVDNLREERYMARLRFWQAGASSGRATKSVYYFLRPFLPVSVRKHIQRAHFRAWEKIPFPHWPVDFTVDSLMEAVLALALKCHNVDRVPFIWFWPNGAPACTMITHDVEGESGRDFCSELMDLDDSFAIKSSFQIVPEGRYKSRQDFLHSLRSRGFEINVHDLNHDGFLFSRRDNFIKRAVLINAYAKEFGAEGFRSGAMYRNQDWYDSLEFSYDMSVPNVAHLEPQRGGCCTVMPYFIGKILELPLTATQDYSLFHILGDYSIDLWKKQIDLIVQRHGLLSFITHPDYLIEERAQGIYTELLSYLVQLRTEKRLWSALPSEVNRWWRNRQQMQLVQDGNRWRIEGPDCERARIAYAILKGDRIDYSLDSESNPVS